MDGNSSNGEDCPQLLNLMPSKRDWLVNMAKTSSSSSTENELELRLGLPGEDRSKSLKESNQNQSSWPSYLKFSSSSSQTKLPEKSQPQPSSSKVVADLQGAGVSKSFLPSSSTVRPAAPNHSQKRTAPASVVGWPPIRSFRKNITSNGSTKPALDSEDAVKEEMTGNKTPENGGKGMFVKINMEGIPIGRKVDLKAYDSYEKLSSAVDELFRGLIAAQKDSPACGISNKDEGKPITGVLDGRGEYTLVYEDNEGDRMLVGDVPWQMFVSSVKRLRVLKRSELSSLSLGSSKQEKMPLK